MDNNALQALEKQYRNDLYNAYIESKRLFISAEEQLSQMSFFVAPLIEHRDALDHIMRYFYIKTTDGLTDNAIKELDRALSHELRAYFDIADYVCIMVRQEINSSLKRISTRKIKKVWDDYVQTKERIVKISEDIAEIRNSRNSSLEHIKKYKVVVNEMFDIYKTYITNIEPRLRKKTLW